MMPPLPLVPFEYYMLEEDRADYPMTFLWRLWFDGPLEREPLESALNAALARHPLLWATVADAGGGTLAWNFVDPPRPRFEWSAHATPLEFPGGVSINLRAETGLRVWVRRGEPATQLALQFHHSCCDGLGSLQFIEDLLVGYHNLRAAAGAPVDMRTLDEQSLRDRGNLDAGSSPHSPWLSTYLRGIGSTIRFFCRRPVEIHTTPPPLVAKQTPGEPLPTRSFQFDAADLQRLQARAKDAGAKLNDLLLRDLFLVLSEWNRRNCPHPSRRHLRLAIPYNMRRSVHAGLSAANMVSLSFLDRTPAECADPSLLLNGISRQMGATSKRRFGTFLRVLRLLSTTRGLRKTVRLQNASATSVLSNLGAILAHGTLPRPDGRLTAGAALLERLEVQMPIGPRTHAAFVAFTYAGGLNVCMTYDPRCFTPEGAQQLLDLYRRHLAQSMDAD